MRKRLLFGMVFVLMALILAGCKMEYDTTIQPDESGRMILSIGFTADEMEMIGASNSATFCQEMWADSSSDFPPGTTIRQEQRGGETWCLADMPFSNLQQLRSVYINQGVTVNRLEIVDNILYYDVAVDLSDAGGLGTSMQVTWRLTMPGRITSHNAHSVEGRTLSWNLNVGSMNRLQAESSVGVGDWVWWVVGGLCCLCLVVLVIGGGIALFVYLRKKKAGTAA
jgi:hypothetical protein